MSFDYCIQTELVIEYIDMWGVLHKTRTNTEIKKKYILGVQDKDSNDDYQTQLNKYNEELQKYIEKNTYNKNFYENDCWIKESYKKRYIKQISCLCPDLHKLVKVYKTHLAWVHM
jgi:hypothetical protein